MAHKQFNIQNNVAGKLKLLDISTSGLTGGFRDVWSDGTYVYVADWSAGLLTFSFDGTDLTYITGSTGTGSEGNWVSVWGDGTYIYTADYYGIKAWSFDGTTLTHLDTHKQFSDAYERVWGDGTYQYAIQNIRIYAYSFNGSVFTYINQYFDLGNLFQDLSGEVITGTTYVYASKAGEGLHALSFNGSAFSYVTATDAGGTYEGLWHDGTYIYCAYQGNGLRVYSFNGVTFSLESESGADGIGGQDLRKVWGDGKYTYISYDIYGVAVYSASASSIYFRSLANPLSGQNWGVFGDSDYIYLVNISNGLAAFKLYENYSA